jgi:ADP-ribosylglycohydrolase
MEREAKKRRVRQRSSRLLISFITRRAMVGEAEHALADRLAGALWGMLIADAIAMPAHWFYGGAAQIRKAFGKPIRGYEAPLSQQGSFPESIMALSSTGGAGRGSSEGDIVGTVINHGKKSFWKRGAGYHYHCSLAKGENTLEGEMARLAVRSMTGGDFDLDRMQQEYADFMTTPGNHNDAYASSYHRMFFQNRAAGKPLSECPSNDEHNVDAIDGLVIPAVVLLGGAARPEAEALRAAQRSVSVTRRSPRVESFVGELSTMLRAVLKGQAAADAAQEAATRLTGRPLDVSTPDPVVACYIDQNFASLLLLLAKHRDFAEATFANANAGGENVHRGLVLGAILGAQAGASGIPEDLKAGLHNRAAIEAEIDAFIAARAGDVSTCGTP